MIHQLNCGEDEGPSKGPETKLTMEEGQGNQGKVDRELGETDFCFSISEPHSMKQTIIYKDVKSVSDGPVPLLGIKDGENNL